MEQDLEADKRPESFSQLQMSQHLVAWSKVCEEVWKRQPKHIENHLKYSITAYVHIDAFPIMKSQTAWSSKDASDQVSGTYFSSDWLWLVDLEAENTLTCMDLGKMSSWSDTIFLHSFPGRVFTCSWMFVWFCKFFLYGLWTPCESCQSWPQCFSASASQAQVTIQVKWVWSN